MPPTPAYALQADLTAALARIAALETKFALKADLDPTTLTLLPGQIPMLALADVSALKTALGMTGASAPTPTSTTPPAAGADLLTAAFKAKLKLGVPAAGGLADAGLALTPGSYQFAYTATSVVGNNGGFGCKFVALDGTDLADSWKKLSPGKQAVTIAVSVTGTFCFAVVGNGDAPVFSDATLTRLP